ncbi:MAG: LacI family DNA-binding transcriptional regulator, partial [Bacteroidales bacterium]|nr:LacI family DNA-binding transcriptional regulator [Bacteroidales bacterium]
MNKPHITIHDIARELNISASTVSRALHNHPRISEVTRAAVHKVAEKYNYQPNVVATSLRQGRSKTVGVIVPRINRNFFANVIGGMEEVLAASGYHLMICQTHEKLENEKTALQTLVNARVDAIILSVSMETSSDDHLRMLRDRGIKLFFFDRIIESLDAGSVVIDDRLGATLNVKHLIGQGYRRIMHVAGADHITIYRARKQGYLDAMAEAGIDVFPEWIIEKPLELEGGEAAFHEGMKLKGKPDAFFCAGDFAALGVMQAAKRSGMWVPDDLGITGFANEPFTAYLQPSLTTVDQRGGEMGRIVADMFMECSDKDSNSTGCGKMVLKPQLIVRE